MGAIVRRTLSLGALAALMLAGCDGRSASPTAATRTTAVTAPAGSATLASTTPMTSATTNTVTPATTATPTTTVSPPSATAAVSSTVAALTTTPRPTGWAAFDQALDGALLVPGNVGMSVAVARNGVIVHASAAGSADPTTGRPATSADRYRIASNSKVLVAVLVLQHVEAGKLGLDQQVLPFIAHHLGLATPDPTLASVTVRELLGHTSGLGTFDNLFFENGAPTCAKAAAIALATPTVNPPGTRFLYSNMNYCLLGLLLSESTGRSLPRLAQDRVLSPLGIKDMRMAGTFDVRPGDVRHPSTAGRTYMEALGPAGAWLATPADLVRIIDSLDPKAGGWHPLRAKTLALMWTKQSGVYTGTNPSFGLGLQTWSDGSWGFVGSLESARSMVLHRPDGLTWAVTVNGNVPGDAAALAAWVNAALAAMDTPSRHHP